MTELVSHKTRSRNEAIRWRKKYQQKEKEVIEKMRRNVEAEARREQVEARSNGKEDVQWRSWGTTNDVPFR